MLGHESDYMGASMSTPRMSQLKLSFKNGKPSINHCLPAIIWVYYPSYSLMKFMVATDPWAFEGAVRSSISPV